MVDGLTQPPSTAPSAGVPTHLPATSVVVATRNRTDKLVRCVQSLLSNDHPQFEVIVVDNAPADASTRSEVTERWGSDLRVRYVLEPHPGAARARNAGVRVCDGDVIAFTDDDVVTDPCWLRVLTSEFGDEGVCAVAGLTVALRLDHEAAAWFEQVSGFGRGHTRRTCNLRSQPPPTRLFPFTPPFGASNNLAVRTTGLRSIGGFDERLGPGTPTRGGEDLDLLTRLLLTGGTIVYRPDAVVRHEHRDTVGELREQLFTYGAGNTAVLTKWALRRPDLRRSLLRLALTAGANAPSGSRPEGVAVAADAEVPGWLRRTIRYGYLAGPWLWLRSSLTDGDGRGPMSLRAWLRGT